MWRKYNNRNAIRKSRNQVRAREIKRIDRHAGEPIRVDPPLEQYTLILISHVGEYRLHVMSLRRARKANQFAVFVDGIRWKDCGKARVLRALGKKIERVRRDE